MGSNPELQDGSTSNLDPLRLFGQIISITVEGGKVFLVHKEVLTKDSEYFKAALNGPFSEAQTNSIDLDDIPPEDFGLYVSVIYPLVLCSTHLEWPDIRDEVVPLSVFLRLWKLGDRLLNNKVCDVAKVEISKHFKGLGVVEWDSMYIRDLEGNVKAAMLTLQSDFRLCKEMGAPFERESVKAASHIPPQAFAAHVDDLEHKEFRSEVMKAFAMRFANPDVTSRKRRNDEGEALQAKKPKPRLKKISSRSIDEA